MKYRFLLILIPFFYSASLSALILEEDTEWSGEVNISEAIEIPINVTLTILPGAIINVSCESTLFGCIDGVDGDIRVYGILKVLGEANNKVEINSSIDGKGGEVVEINYATLAPPFSRGYMSISNSALPEGGEFASGERLFLVNNVFGMPDEFRQEVSISSFGRVDIINNLFHDTLEINLHENSSYNVFFNDFNVAENEWFGVDAILLADQGSVLDAICLEIHFNYFAAVDLDQLDEYIKDRKDSLSYAYEINPRTNLEIPANEFLVQAPDLSEYSYSECHALPPGFDAPSQGENALDETSVLSLLETLTEEELSPIMNSNGASSSALIKAAATFNYRALTDTVFIESDRIQITATITPEADDVGSSSEVFVVLLKKGAAGKTLSYLDSQYIWRAWNGKWLDLQSFKSYSTMEESFRILAFDGAITQGSYHLYFGYKLDDNDSPIHFNADSLAIEVVGGRSRKKCLKSDELEGCSVFGLGVISK